METLQEKAKRLGIQPAAKPITTQGETLQQKAQRLGIKPKSGQSFRFDVEDPAARQNKLAQYQSEAATAQTEAKKANSFLGKAANFGKAAVGMIANSEVGLGQSIAKIIGANDTTLTDAQQSNSDMEAKLLKLINEKRARGEDTSRLELAYNRQKDSGKEVNDLVGEQFNLPSTAKVVGQIGGTALDILTAGTYGKATKMMTTGQRFVQPSVVKNVAAGAGLPELGSIAGQKAAGLLTKRGAANIATGAGIGYASDVTQGLQGARGEDREGAKAFIPGLGTALGTAIPVLSETNQSIKNQFDPTTKANNLASKRQAELDKLDSYQTLKKATEKGRERGIDVKKVLSETDVLHGAVDTTGTITTKGEGGAVEQYTRQFIDGNEKLVSEALKKEGRSIAADVVRAKLRRALLDAGIEGKDLQRALAGVEAEMSGYAVRGGGKTIPVSTLHDAKIDKYNTINFFTDGSKSKYAKAVARALKELVEENTTSIQVKKVNEELSKHFAVIDYLNKLDNKKVEGGKLGKYFAQTVGAIVGSNMGPLGAIIGAEAGSRLKGGLMSRVFNGKTGRVQPQAGVITDAQKAIDAPPLGLPAAGGTTQTPAPTIPLGTRTQSAAEAAERRNPNIKKPQQSPKPSATLQLPPPSGKGQGVPIPLKPPASSVGVFERQSSKSAGSLKTNQSTTMAPTKNVIPSTVLPSANKSSELSTAKPTVAEEYWQNRQQSIEELRTSMLDIAETGTAKTADGGFYRTTSFPDWIPSNLRSKDLFRKVFDHIDNDTVPKGETQKTLYDLLLKRVDDGIDNIKSRPTETSAGAFAGFGMGFEKDEEGKWKFNKEKAALGMVGIAGLTGSKAAGKLSRKLSTTGLKLEKMTDNQLTALNDFIRRLDQGGTPDIQDALSLRKYITSRGGNVDGVTDKQLSGFLKSELEANQEAFKRFASLPDQAQAGKTVRPKPKPPAPKPNRPGAMDIKPLGKATPKDVADPKKYKTAEEFVKAQGTPAYIGAPKGIKQFTRIDDRDSLTFGGGIYASPEKNIAKSYSNTEGQLYEVYLEMKNPWILDKAPEEQVLDFFQQSTSAKKTAWLRKNGYDGVIDSGADGGLNEMMVLDPSQVKTRTQLTDIWKQANK